MKHHDKTTDDKLVEMFASGNDEAFDVLLKRHQDRLYTYITYIVRNKDLADDLFQETFVKAIMTIRQGRYSADGKFYSWLTRIAHNLLIDQFRFEKSDIIVSDDAEKCNASKELLFDICRESELSNEQVMVDLKKLMDHLPDNQREVLFMRFYQDMSFKEISETTGVSINTALGRFRYGISNMRKMAETHHINLAIE